MIKRSQICSFVLLINIICSFVFNINYPYKANALSQDNKPLFDISIKDISPAILKKNDNLYITVYIKNISSKEQKNINVNLKFEPQIIVNRDQIESWSCGKHIGSNHLETKNIDYLANNDNDTVYFDISSKYFKDFFDTWGAYGISIDITIGEDTNIKEVISSFLILHNNSHHQYKPISLTPLISMNASPTNNLPPGNIPNFDQKFSNDSQFDNLLKIAKNSSVSIGVDAIIIKSAESSFNSKTKMWLEDYKNLNNEIINIPAFSPNIMAIIHSNENESYKNFLDKIKNSIPSDPRGIDDIVWLDKSNIDQHTLSKFSTKDIFLIDSSNLDYREDIVFTPNALTNIYSFDSFLNYRTVVIDHHLSKQLNDVNSYKSQSSINQRFLAETATIVRELPNSSRNIVIASSFDWSPEPEKINNLMKTLADCPWIRFSTLKDVLRSSVNSDYGHIKENSEDHHHLHSNELINANFIKETNEIRNQILNFAKIVDGESSLKSKASIALAQVSSISFKNDLEQQKQFFNNWNTTYNNILNSIEIVEPSNLNLLTDAADVKFLIINKHNEPVNIQVNVTTSNTKLKVEQPPLVHIEPYRQANITVSLKVISSGQSVLTLTPESTDGYKVGKEINIPVSLNIKWGNIVTNIILIISILLISIGIIRTIRK